MEIHGEKTYLKYTSPV